MEHDDLIQRFSVCGGPRCTERGSRQLLHEAERFLRLDGLAARVELAQIIGVCHGKCRFGPNVFVSPGNYWYCGITADGIETVIRHHLASGQPVEYLLGREPAVLDLDVTFPWD